MFHAQGERPAVRREQQIALVRDVPRLRAQQAPLAHFVRGSDARSPGSDASILFPLISEVFAHAYHPLYHTSFNDDDECVPESSVVSNREIFHAG